MPSYKVYVKKTGSPGTMDKLWDVVTVEAETEEELNNKINELFKKGWKVFRINKI
ncbi:MAG: hypothetical protein OdinLCB4_002710 [Candidatus Odinarchaeum yellowstonii]|jgi:hypothetical protein|uniref:Uncharacterized protein n=1 Tax=Odinarchaeota yellowstonii (strain LCB_4) TaxID=1841599 RepID=A0AAF0D374_ODILC|nr:MAG: hypothetical protein OdinLCB4_002710 [Candidatus Odinarchaeum yellowstonii]